MLLTTVILVVFCSIIAVIVIYFFQVGEKKNDVMKLLDVLIIEKYCNISNIMKGHLNFIKTNSRWFDVLSFIKNEVRIWNDKRKKLLNF